MFPFPCQPHAGAHRQASRLFLCAVFTAITGGAGGFSHSGAAENPPAVEQANTEKSNVEKKNPDNQDALPKLLAHLQTSEEALKRVTSYTATFIKEEAVSGKLQDPETIQLKLRHQPFSVYMKWKDQAQEVLFVEGRNDGKLVVKPSGLAGLVGTLRIDPLSQDALKNSRYPITEAGLARLVARIRKFYLELPAQGAGVKCRYSEQKNENHPLDVFEVVFQDQNQSPDYHSSRFAFDQKSKVLISVENFGWPEKAGKEPAVVERYQFNDLNFTANLTDHDFDQKNSSYNF